MSRLNLIYKNTIKINKFQNLRKLHNSSFKYSHSYNQNFNTNYSDLYSTGAILTVTGVAVLLGIDLYEKTKNDEYNPNQDNKVATNSDITVQTMTQKDLQSLNYQNRIRRYSTPDKVFRLFASIKVQDTSDPSKGRVFMTPDDFVRSITPCEIQPNDLILDKYHKVTSSNLQKMLKQQENESMASLKHENSVFDKICQRGLLSFSDYIFLLTVLSTSAKHWQILFKVFDENGDGEVDRLEFSRVMQLAKSSTTVGSRHRDIKANKATNVLESNSAISDFFFHSDNTKLKLDDFVKFYSQLKRDILRIQFNKEKPNSEDKISKISLANMLLAYIERTDTRIHVFERCKKVLASTGTGKPMRKSKGVEFKEVEKLFSFLSCVEDIEMALDMHTSAGVELTKNEFMHVAHVVCKADLDPNVVDVVYAVFDVDGSGGLSHKEFLKTIKARASYGLDKPKDTGLWRFIHSVFACTSQKIKNEFFS